MKLLFLCGDLANNQLGRVHSLHLIARLGGHDTLIQSIVQSSDFWQPLASSDFAHICQKVTAREVLDTAREWADIIITVKAFPETLGLGLKVSHATGKTLLADIDDPDIEAYTAWDRKSRIIARKLRHPLKFRRWVKLKQATAGLPTMTSNPTLQALYGGTIIPHARPDLGLGAAHTSRLPTVAFIGTPREHKGIEQLRTALSTLGPRGWKLLVTAPPPPDAKPWEMWVGRTTSDEGMTLLRSSDIVALPSSGTRYGSAQLPMKLVDAMLAGRAVAASPRDPIKWALDGCGISFDDTSVSSLQSALLQLSDPDLRMTLGERARRRALESFTPEALLPDFNFALNDAIARGPKGNIGRSTSGTGP